MARPFRAARKRKCAAARAEGVSTGREPRAGRSLEGMWPALQRFAHACALALALAGAMWILAPAPAAVLAIVGLCAFVAHGAAHRRLAAVENGACLAFLIAMFDLEGAGGFALVAALALEPGRVLLRGVRPATALAVIAPLAGIAAALIPQVEAYWPRAWAAFAPMAPALLLAAPAPVLTRLAVLARGEEAGIAGRLNALGAMLVALVVGASLGGLPGAAAGWATARLAGPLALILLGPRHRAMAWEAAGVLAASAIGAIACVLAPAWPVALLSGLVVYVVALRVHAPAAARRLGRIAQRLRPQPRPLPAPQPAG
jgi:hypothetical protein